MQTDPGGRAETTRCSDLGDDEYIVRAMLLEPDAADAVTPNPVDVEGTHLPIQVDHPSASVRPAWLHATLVDVAPFADAAEAMTRSNEAPP